MGSPDIAAVVIDFVRRAKARNPKLLYLCDPVMGDADSGFYLSEELRVLFAKALVPLADIITPNQFELECLVAPQARDDSRHRRRSARACGIDDHGRRSAC